MSDASFGSLMSQLLKQRSFCLQKISPTTYHGDVITTHKRQNRQITDVEIAGIKAILEGKDAFRCRIGKKPFRYGATVSDAIQAALEQQKGQHGTSTPTDSSGPGPGTGAAGPN